MGDWKQVLGAVAPSLATALGGPLAGMATKAIAGALLGDENASADDVAQAVANASPEQLAAIKKVDADFKVQMKALDVDLERISASDRDSARRLAATTGDPTPKVLAYLYAAAFFAVIAFQCWMAYKQVDLPQMAGKTLDMLLGVLTAMVLGSKEYYFGSSSSSAKKTEIMAMEKAGRS
jgi:ABC-type glycerol-3-phosphate transport system substrate-binding protein